MRIKWWAALLGVVILVIIVLNDTHHLGVLELMYRVPHADKVAHFGLFGLLSLLTNLAVFERWPRLARSALALRTSGLLAVLMALEELSQKLFPNRTASVWDLAAGWLGVMCFTFLALFIACRRAASTTAI